MQIRFNYALRHSSFSTNYKNYGQLGQIKIDNEYLQNITNPQYQMIKYYRDNGHLFTYLDPLNLLPKSEQFPLPIDFGVKYEDKVQNQFISKQSINTIEELQNYLDKLYTQSVGVQFDHIEDPNERQWLYTNYESFMNAPLSSGEKVNISSLLIQTEAVDHFLGIKYASFKRYAGEGGESTSILLKAIYAQASELGVTNIIQSMAHRGRFPLMCTLLDYAPADIFRKISGGNDMPEEYTHGVCDVVHHLSTSNSKRYLGTGCKEKDIRVSVVHNPSHLEAANPVSQGKTKAKQDDYQNQEQVLNLQLHGDAAFAGQGIIQESLLLQSLDNYTIGGTIHIIQNNQIGYTTNLKDSRSTRYCSDIMLAYKYPVIHVNGDDVESVHKLGKFVAHYRQQFKKDILIDLVTYRRYGHNELDEPSFTQPKMYEQVRQQTTLPKQYSQKLQEQGLQKQEDYEKIRKIVFTHLESEFEKSKTSKQSLAKITDDSTKGSKAFTQKWAGIQFSQFCSQQAITGVHKDNLIELAKQSVCIKNGFNLHPRLQKHFIDERLKFLQENTIDWSTAEAMAISSLLQDGYNIRISGQDVERGTFSQRHFVFTDQKTEEKWNPLQFFHESKHQGRLQVVNSPLSEAAVMAYEFGYGMENPRNLAIWEAQFGDFYNTGQSIVDTFITCAEEKWMRQSSLVMLLPHGYDGAGPEHSSSRMERWLQMGIQAQNFQFAFPSSPASLFHLLRRQMLRQYRKPLIIANAKTLLRQQSARCKVEELDINTQFKPIRIIENGQVDKLLFCYGKMLHTIQQRISEKKYQNYAIIGIEQLLPFPKEELETILLKYKSTKAYFIQEEPQNAGGYNYCKEHIPLDLQYIGRKESPLVASGASILHKKETQEIEQQFDKIFS